jgi:hypothetical protein
LSNRRPRVEVTLAVWLESRRRVGAIDEAAALLGWRHGVVERERGPGHVSTERLAVTLRLMEILGLDGKGRRMNSRSWLESPCWGGLEWTTVQELRRWLLRRAMRAYEDAVDSGGSPYGVAAW